MPAKRHSVNYHTTVTNLVLQSEAADAV